MPKNKDNRQIQINIDGIDLTSGATELAAALSYNGIPAKDVEAIANGLLKRISSAIIQENLIAIIEPDDNGDYIASILTIERNDL